MNISLDRFITKEPKEQEKKPKQEQLEPKPKPIEAPKIVIEKEAEEEPEEEEEELEAEVEGAEEPEEALLEETAFEAEMPENTGPCFLLSVSYSGKKGCALVKLYDPEKGKIYFWYDNTGHRPYLLTDMPLQEVLKNPNVLKHPGFDPSHCQVVKKIDLLSDTEIELTKVTAKDPLSIGGRGKGLRDIIPQTWESRIRYHDCYIYDRELYPGYLYRIRNGVLERVDYKVSDEEIEAFKKIFPPGDEIFEEALNRWLPLFSCPAPSYRRVAIDIEVSTPQLDRIPDAKAAEYPVISAAIVSSDGIRRVLLLKRSEVPLGERPPELENVELVFYDDEKKLLEDLFKILSSYPIVLTFNGDNFDLRYLWHRALKLGFRKDQIPITLGREVALLSVGIHVDLYKLLHNKAIQVYAFGNKYREVTLDSVASALLGVKKVPLEKLVTELSYMDLAAYCFRDAELTYNLSSFNNDMVMNLITLLMRISRLSMEDVTRQGVSNWIKNLLYFEHRRRGYLIPRQEDILRIKGETFTRAVIKGKKYLGAIVIEPRPGVYFNVVVLDFASLYPSIIKQWNISYETVRCPHPECRNNLLPNTPHWVCRKRRGLMSLITGLLRDIRVYWFKPKSKDKSLSEDLRRWYDIVQHALKVILNASYGVFGAEVFPLYCPPAAESTTAIGRYVITNTIAKARQEGVDVIYGDTDSVFLHDPSQEQINTLLDWVEKQFSIDLEVDKVYSYVTFSKRKKNYLGVLPNGVVDIKGLVGKKRNTPMFIKKAFEEMVGELSKVRSPEDFEKAKEKIKEIAKACYFGLKNRRFSLDDLAFKVMLSRDVNKYVKTTPQHVKAAKQLVSKGVELKPGDIISYVKVTTPVGVKPVQLARIDEIDADKYIGHIRTTFEQVLDALGIEFDEIIGVTTLDLFAKH
ncbi:MAG: DNA-directed DNA polymerase I [Candidatus Methanomethylicota archaeon]|uniref:DNA polymerase n=2 Tax=Thermoproteota archaeon TaxID=2056631 RepID=A0A497ERG9_9CREN|nr:MAG: DNA-directed DNA polymerase I [Candidatus Verstraetearchaeota archaeon]